MSIKEIKNLSLGLKSGKLFSLIKGTATFGNTNIAKELKELFNLIEAYKEPDPIVDTPPKARTRRSRAIKKDITTE